eukprot:gene5464-9282_t
MKVFVFCLLFFQIFAYEYYNFTKIFASEEFQRIKYMTKKEESALNFKSTVNNFPCKPLTASHPPPEDASRLRFPDIKVMMALGDSITAGFGILSESYTSAIYEYRGMAGLIGADEGAPTIFNYFKKIGNKMEGGSIGKSIPWYAIRWPWTVRPHNPPVDKLNAAQSRAKLAASLGQVDYLISQGRKEPNIDFDKDWKMLHILLGGNDLFECNLPASQPDEFERKLNLTLTKIHDKIPRVFVNLYSIFEKGFVDIYNAGKDSFYCRTLWGIIQRGIECMMKPEMHEKMTALAKEYNVRIDRIAKYWNSRRKKDFFVAVQPPLKNARIPDRTHTSKLDCFHPSAKSNAELSMSIWNSLQLPADKKPTAAVKEYICPNENTIIQ